LKPIPWASSPSPRSADALAPWAIPGTPGLEPASAASKKQDVTGNINYEPLNHENMVRLRAARSEAIAQDISARRAREGDPDGDLLIVAWGSTHGAITAAVKAQRQESCGPQAHRPSPSAHLNPLAFKRR